MSGGLSVPKLTTIAIENLGRELALWALERTRRSDGPAPAVLAGPGAEGITALVAARHLANWELDPEVVIFGAADGAPEYKAALAFLKRIGARTREPAGADKMESVASAIDRRAALVVGVSRAGALPPQGKEDETQAIARSAKAERIMRIADTASAERGESAREALFSVQARSSAPAPGAAMIRIEAAPRDGQTVRLLDSTAIREYGIPSLGLMENAGYWTARELWKRLPEPKKARVAVLAGRGNNGGDGFVIARHLAWWGIGEIKVYLAGRESEMLDDAQVNLDYLSAPGVQVTEMTDASQLVRAGGDIRRADWLVDALLGTGLTGKVRGVTADVIEFARSVGKPVLAVDTPSGLDATDGTSHGALLPATVTVTYGVPKQGFFVGEGPKAVGELVVADISLPKKISGAKVVVA